MAAIREERFTAEMAKMHGNCTHFDGTLLAWAATYGNEDACAICLDAGLSPTSIRGSLCPLLVALSSGASQRLILMLVAAGATMEGCNAEATDEYVRLLARTKDVPLVKAIVSSCGLARPTVPNCIVYCTVRNWAGSEDAPTTGITRALATAQTLRPLTAAWWSSIHIGQRARVVTFLCCMAKRGIGLPLELTSLIVGMLRHTVCWHNSHCEIIYS